MFLSKRWRVAFRRATSKPPLSKWLWVLKDAGLSHLSVPLLVKISRGQQPWENLCRSVDPSGELGFAAPSHSRTTPVPHECCPHFASGSCPWENYSAIDFLCPPRSHSPDTTANGSVERSVPPRTDLSLRGFVASPYEEPFASARRPTTCEWPLPGVKGHIPHRTDLPWEVQ